MWSTDYVQVPIEDKCKKFDTESDDESLLRTSVLSKLPSPTGEDPSQESTTESKIQEYVRRLSLVGSQEGKESGEIYCWMMGNISPPPGKGIINCSFFMSGFICYTMLFCCFRRFN